MKNWNMKVNKKWNGKWYDKNGNIIYELINSNGEVKEYSYKSDDRSIFKGNYLNGKNMEKEKNIILIVN